MEIWKPIPIKELENYEVSDTGCVRHRKHLKKIKFGNLRGHLTFRYKPGKNKGGTYLVHRLVALAFIPNPHNYPVVNHLNGDRGDNRIENLEWTTGTANAVHGVLRRKGKTNSKYQKIKDLYASKNWTDTKTFYEGVLDLFD